MPRGLLAPKALPRQPGPRSPPSPGPTSAELCSAVPRPAGAHPRPPPGTSCVWPSRRRGSPRPGDSLKRGTWAGEGTQQAGASPAGRWLVTLLHVAGGRRTRAPAAGSAGDLTAWRGRSRLTPGGGVGEGAAAGRVGPGVFRTRSPGKDTLGGWGPAPQKAVVPSRVPPPGDRRHCPGGMFGGHSAGGGERWHRRNGLAHGVSTAAGTWLTGARRQPGGWGCAFPPQEHLWGR